MVKSKIWRCDVCKTRTFQTLEEAVEHESKCTIHPFFQGQKAKRSVDDATRKSAPSVSKKAKKQKIQGNGKKLGDFFGSKKKKTELKPSPTRTENVVLLCNDNEKPVTDENTLREQQAALDFYAKKKDKKPPPESKPPPSRSKHYPPRFPVPSHVVPDTEESEVSCSNAPIHFPRNHAPVVIDLKSESCDPFPLVCNALDDSNSNLKESDELLQVALAEVLTPTIHTSSTRETLLVDDYYKTLDTEAEVQLTDFVQRFMVRRSEALEKAAKRHQKLAGKKSIRKKAKTKRSFGQIYDNDDLWEDEDECSRAEMTVCLITGPVGCAKTSTVHRVAAATGCDTVLELHPGQARGGAQLRKLLEESTQSHSSKDMFQKKNAIVEQSRMLVDSDDESESDAKGSSVTIILLDEADTVFETDAGFWSTITEFSLKSKCPLVLTANTLPAGLTTGYTHIRMERPSVDAFVDWFRNVAVETGYAVRGDTERVARLAGCDMRRILNAMQTLSIEVQDIEMSEETPEENQPVKDDDIAASIICVEAVSPQSILADEHVVLSIKGRNFERLVSGPKDETGGYPCLVKWGSEVSPGATVVNDSTVVAVFQPYKLPPFLDKTGLYKGSHRRSLSAAHPYIAVMSFHGLSSEGAVASADLPDGTSVLQCANRCNLDLQFPGSIPHAYSPSRQRRVDDDEEMEFHVEGESPSVAATVGYHGETQGTNRLSSNKVKVILRRHIDSLGVGGEIEVIGLDKLDRSDVAAMSELDRVCELSSDAALLCDYHDLAIPFLAGSCNGFGYEFTDEHPRRSNEKNKPPSEERLYIDGYNEQNYFYGDPETYVTMPTGTLERKLMTRTERLSRGSARPPPVVSTAEEDKNETVHTHWDEQFLPAEWPFSLDMISHLLDHHRSNWSKVGMAQQETILLNQSRQSEWLSFLENNLCAGDFTAQRQLRFRLMSRCIDPVMEPISNKEVFLDYLPVLRNMTVLDHSRRSQLPNEQKQTARRTRRSRKESSRYLDLILPDYVTKMHEDSELVEMEARLRRSSLIINSK